MSNVSETEIVHLTEPTIKYENETVLTQPSEIQLESETYFVRPASIKLQSETVYIPPSKTHFENETIIMASPKATVEKETIIITTPIKKVERETIYVATKGPKRVAETVYIPQPAATEKLSTSKTTLVASIKNRDTNVVKISSSKKTSSVVPFNENVNRDIRSTVTPAAVVMGKSTNKCVSIIGVLIGILITAMLIVAVIVPILIGPKPDENQSTTVTTSTSTTTTSETTTTSTTTTTTETTTTESTTSTSETTTTSVTTTSTSSTSTTSTTSTSTTTTSTTSSTSTSSTSSTSTSTSTTSVTMTTTTSTTSSTSTTSTSSTSTSTTSTSTTTTASVPLTLTGVQVDLDPAALPSGWLLCYSDVYNVTLNSSLLDSIFIQCNRSKLLVACRHINSTILSVAAMGYRSDVLWNCANLTNCVHVANNVGWYYSNDYSWGFVDGTDTVNRVICDSGTLIQFDADNNDAKYDLNYIDLSDASTLGSTNPNKRLCWHTGNHGGGYRCGSKVGLNYDTDYVRVIYHVD